MKVLLPLHSIKSAPDFKHLGQLNEISIHIYFLIKKSLSRGEYD